MSFWLYKNENNRCERIGPVKLTGTEGILARFLAEHKDEDTPFAWRLDNPEMINLIDPELDPATHMLVLDLLPESFFEASLQEVTHLQGCSEYDESDVVLACRVLYQGKTSVHSETFKAAFVAEPPENGRQQLEALRLTGGMQKGNYFWASPKMDIGAAVCAS